MATNTENISFRIPSGELLAIKPDVLQGIASFNGQPFADIRAALSRPGSSNIETSDDGVAVIPIIGAISRYDTLCSRIFGGVSVDSIQSQISDALNDSTVKAIVLEVDSPGGMVAGVPDLADTIRAATSVKPIVAFVSDLGASAAYWLCSAASKIVVSQAAFVGSIGVVATYIDSSKQNDKAGLQEIEIVSSQSPKKRPDPTSEDGKAQIQTSVDAIADIFVSAVASFRGTTPANVLAAFGQGDVVLGESAVTIGMADKVGTMADAVSLASSLTLRDLSFELPAASGLKQGEMIMETDEKMYTSAQIAEMLAGAKAEERSRIQGIFGIVTNEHMASDGPAIKAALFDGKSTTGDVAAVILAAQNLRRSAMQTARDLDASQIPAFDPGASAQAEVTEEMAAAAGIASYDPRKRGVKR